VVHEALLRQTVLRAYHEKREMGGSNKAAKAAKAALAAVRQFLSGAPGTMVSSERYWFEEDPRASVASFVADLERALPGLARAVLEPVLAQARQGRAEGRRELALNLSLYVSGLAGAVAVKTGLDETLAAGVVAAVILGLSRLGAETLASGLVPVEKDDEDDDDDDDDDKVKRR
jgi:hypothetical protein